MFNKILLCSDGSEGALKAAKAAGTLAEKFQASLTVLHVFQIPAEFTPLMPMTGFSLDPERLDEAAKQAREAVARHVASALEGRNVQYDFRQETGYPAEVIVQVAEEEASDLIVLGSRGLGAFKAFFLGSVSHRVSHHAPCSVLIVK